MWWVVILYNETSTIVEGWWRDANTVESSDNKDEKSEDTNLSSVDYGVTSPIMVVTVFVASKDVTGPNFTVMNNVLQFCNQL